MGHQDTEAAWAAGFFDGEGCSYLHFAKGHPRVRMHVTQKEPELLFRFL